MTPSESIRHNAKILLPRVRGKSTEERREFLSMMRIGILFAPIASLTLFGLRQQQQG